jgi:hypothetical protein
MSNQIETSDENVINYLKKLWNSDLLTQEKNTSSISSTDQLKQSKIQKLIDSKLINSINNTQNLPDQNMVSEKMDSTNLPDQNIVSEKMDSTNLPDQNMVSEKMDSTNLPDQNIVSEKMDSTNLPDQNMVSEKMDSTNLPDQNMVSEKMDSTNLPDQNVTDEDLMNIQINMKDKKEFKKDVKANLKAIREIGFRVYHNIGLEKEVNLQTDTVTNQDLEKVYYYKIGSELTRKSLMTDISKSTIFPKYKSGEKDKPENYRYLVNHHNSVKILDRLWCLDLLLKIKNNLPDGEIYKASLFSNYSKSVIDVAMENTQSIDSVILLDVQKAFDSMEWNHLEDLLLSNLKRKTTEENAFELVNQYMTILKNRELYYNDKLVEVSKGIPTGLPSSNLVFTIVMEEIIHRWFINTKFQNNVEFKIMVYVDDIYLKMLQIDKTQMVVNSLIDFLAIYNLKINKEKCRADPSLPVNIPNKLKTSDYYLGIPFTRDIKLYGRLILNEFQKNKINMSWNEIYEELVNQNDQEVIGKIVGFFNYKLRPFINMDETDSTITIKIARFIHNNYIDTSDYELEYLIILMFLTLMISTAMYMSS